jgi:glycosyltransferase involved in cell wall biosynthesis
MSSFPAMPTVLLINECLDFSTGGIARQIGETAIKHGWESYIAYSARESYYPTLCHTYAIGSKGEFYLHALETRLLDNHGLASRCATKRLIKRIGEIHPDVIHLHNIHGYYLNYEALFAYLNTAKIPVVWTLHDCWTFTGHCAHFEPIGCFKWQNKCERCALKNEYPKSWFVDRSERNYTRKKAAFTSIEKVTIVPVSRWLSKFLPYSFLSRFPFRVINNGIDLDIFKPSGDNLYVAYKEKGKIILLGVTNRWEGSKGLDDFIKLGLDDRFQVVLVGSCAGIRKSLPKTILTMGYVQDQKELAGIYSSADVFVNPTYADTGGYLPNGW